MAITDQPNESWENNSSSGKKYNFPEFSLENLKMVNKSFAEVMLWMAASRKSEDKGELDIEELINYLSGQQPTRKKKLGRPKGSGKKKTDKKKNKKTDKKTVKESGKETKKKNGNKKDKKSVKKKMVEKKIKK